MINHSNMKLGKKAAKFDNKRLSLGSYLPVSVPVTPISQDWIGAIDNWGMFCNDKLGCCTIAALGHAIQVWTANKWNGTEIVLSDLDIAVLYRKWTGYNGTEETDQGAAEIDILNFFRRDSIACLKDSVGGTFHDLLAYVDLEHQNRKHLELSILLFGGVYLGLNLPHTAQVQDVWDFAPAPGCEPGSWGGHAVFCPRYSQDGITCITWGKPKLMTWNFWRMYCDEAHALLSGDWINDKGVSAYGLDAEKIMLDLRQMGNIK